MLWRSLYLFGALVLIGLVLTLGYAALRFHGPGDVIATAQARFARGEYLRVIADLDLNERSPSMQGDPSKRRALLRLRYQAHMQLGNAVAALRDLERLLADLEAPDEPLRLDHIRLLALTEDAERASQEAARYLAEHPDDGQALELAGEAGQSDYRRELRALHAAIELDVGATVARTAARPALLAYLYRPEADPEVDQALADLRTIYADQSHLVAAWQPLQRRLLALRARIQETLGYFRRSLERGGEPVAAFRGLALSLEQSRRLDDLLILCESYRRRFDHEYVIEAGAIAAWALQQQGLGEAAIATASRWLPPGTAAERLAAGKLGPKVIDLLNATIVAAYERGDLGVLQQAGREAGALNSAGLTAYLTAALAYGLASRLRDDRQGLRRLEQATTFALRAPTPHGQRDLLEIIMPARLHLLALHGGSAADFAAVFTAWRDARPTAVEPLLAQAGHQAESGAHSGAMVTLDLAERLRPGDAGILTLRIRVARELYRSTNQDGPGLLRQCQERRTLVADVPHPVCHLLCAEAALESGIAAIARASARAATEAMPRSREGHLLLARAELLAGRPADAARIMRHTIGSFPPDAATMPLALEAHRAASEPATDLLWQALRACAPDPDVAVELMRHLAEADAANAAPFAAAALALPKLPVRGRVLAAAALARAGDAAEAERTLRAVDDEQLAADDLCAPLAATIADLLRLAADGTEDAELAGRARRLVAEFDLASPAAAPALLARARDFATSHKATAWFLLTTALGAAAPADRTGADFALAGRLGLELGQLGLAEQYLTAAIAFPDGRAAAEPLARLCLATERPERALQVHRLVAAPADPALALRCGNAAEAQRIATRDLRLDGGDLLAHATVAAAGGESPLPDLAPTTEPERTSLLELASLLRSPELAARALELAERFAAAKPGIGARLLLARALYQAGRVEAAAGLHRDLLAEQVDSLVLWREVAGGAATPGYELAPTVAVPFAAAAATGKLDASPFAFAVATMHAADVIERGGQAPAIAANLRTSVWLRFDPARPYPERCRPDLEDLVELERSGRPLEAWSLLDRLRPTLRGAARARCVERMLAIARTSEALAPQDRRAIYEAVGALAGTEGPRGDIMHFLLDRGDAFPALRPDAARTDELLVGHLMLAATGADGVEHVSWAVDRLLAARGAAAALEAVEAALRRCPTALALWSERTRLMALQRRTREGIDDLRRVLAHADTPQLRLECVARAAAAFALTADDVAWLAQCDPALRESPPGRLTAGLVALRRGMPDVAAALLEDAATGGGAERLFALAQALLQSTRADTVPAAITVLEQLLTEFPDSSEARYAASFVRQLGG